MPRETQVAPERPREAHICPERFRESQVCPVNRLGDPYTKPPGELNTY